MGQNVPLSKTLLFGEHPSGEKLFGSWQAFESKADSRRTEAKGIAIAI